MRWGEELARVEARVGRSGTPPEDRDAVEVALVRTAERRRPQADPGERRRAPRRRPGRGAPDRPVRARGDAARRGLAVPPPRGARPAGRPALARLRPRARDLRPGAPAAQRPAAGDPRGAGDPGGAAVLGPDAARRPGGRSARSASGCCARSRGRWRPPTREIAPDEAAVGRLAAGLRDQRARSTRASPCGTRWPAASRRRPRRRPGTARRSSGPTATTSCSRWAAGPLASFASRGQQRTAILAFKLAELDLLTALDGRPPLLLLDDVFSELDPERRAHLVRRIAALPQAFVTTTTLDDIDPALRSVGTAWAVTTDAGRHLAPRARTARWMTRPRVPGAAPPAGPGRRPPARGRPRARPRGRAAAGPGDRRPGTRIIAERVPPAVGCVPPRRAGAATRSSSRSMSRSSRRSSGCAPWSCWRRSRPPRRDPRAPAAAPGRYWRGAGGRR